MKQKKLKISDKKNIDRRIGHTIIFSGGVWLSSLYTDGSYFVNLNKVK